MKSREECELLLLRCGNLVADAEHEAGLLQKQLTNVNERILELKTHFSLLAACSDFNIKKKPRNIYECDAFLDAAEKTKGVLKEKIAKESQSKMSLLFKKKISAFEEELSFVRKKFDEIWEMKVQFAMQADEKRESLRMKYRDCIDPVVLAYSFSNEAFNCQQHDILELSVCQQVALETLREKVLLRRNELKLHIDNLLMRLAILTLSEHDAAEDCDFMAEPASIADCDNMLEAAGKCKEQIKEDLRINLYPEDQVDLMKSQLAVVHKRVDELVEAKKKLLIGAEEQHR